MPGGWRGWAALLAGGVGTPELPAEFLDLAAGGSLRRDVADRQAPRALAWAPDIASAIVGVNDTLRPAFDIGRLSRALDEVLGVLGAFAARGTVLLTACLPDPGAVLALPAPLAHPLARRQRAVNAVVHVLSDRHGAVHLHAAGPPWAADRSLWSADRLHPGERGHRTLARAFHALSAPRGLAPGAAPSAEPDRPRPTRTDTLRRLATAGAGRVARRCTGLVPQLLRPAGEETVHRARGTAGILGREADAAPAAALAALRPTAAGPAGPRVPPPPGRAGRTREPGARMGA